MEESNRDANAPTYKEDEAREAYVNSPIFMAYDLSNLGRTTWSNIRFEIVGEDIQAERKTVLLGKIEAGSTGVAEMQFSF